MCDQSVPRTWKTWAKSNATWGHGAAAAAEAAAAAVALAASVAADDSQRQRTTKRMTSTTRWGMEEEEDGDGTVAREEDGYRGEGRKFFFIIYVGRLSLSP